EPCQAYRSGRSQIGLHGVATIGALWHSACHDAPGHGAGKPGHAHVGSRKESRRIAAKTHRSDDSVFPAGAVHRHPWSGRDQSDGAEIKAVASDALTLLPLAAALS